FKVILFNILLIVNSNLYSQWFEEGTIPTTVLLEKFENGQYITHGTGFLLYNYDNPTESIVVTCAHLLKEKSEIFVRVKPDSSFFNNFKGLGTKELNFNNIKIINNTVRFIAQLGLKNKFIDNDLDIAVFTINLIVPNEAVNVTKLNCIPKSYISYKTELKLGDEVFFNGFPLGHGATDFVEPIIRSGSIAWLPMNKNYFLLDAFSYGGNSGSPIFRKTTGSSYSYILGMVRGHFTDEKNDNIGLAICVYMDDIMKIVEKFQKIEK
ncbi:MAG: serine protease, partial [Sediminibacterium sp.]|nr:serine protease [Sediminibacterium sp.]